MSEIVGEKIRKLRIARGQTLESLATEVGSTKAYIWQLENKKPARPSADLLLKLATALSVSPDFLLDDTVKEQTKNQTAEALFRNVQQKKLSKKDIETLISIADSFSKKK